MLTTIALIDFWEIDPLPVPPAPFGTAAYWRWRSAKTLAKELAADALAVKK